MDTLGLAQALVCGVSVGGMIALALSSARPDLTIGLFLSNTGHKIGTYEMWNDRIKAVNELGLEAMADDLLERWFSGYFWQNETVQIEGYRMMLSRTPGRGYASVCAAIRDVELANKIASINCRTFCLAGSEDKATPPEVVAALADKIQGQCTILSRVSDIFQLSKLQTQSHNIYVNKWPSWYDINLQPSVV